MSHFARYVALGDSSTEGLDDPIDAHTYRGWADRFAQHVATAQRSPLLYANLGVRGRHTHEVHTEQLAPALTMRPDLATVFAGTNDVVGSGFDPALVGAHIHEMQHALVQQGAMVLTFTLPDLSPVMPIARLVRTRVARLNDAIREACARSGARLVDMAAHPVGSDPRLWSDDRLHANSAGHARVAHALAHAAGIPGFDDSWTAPLPPLSRSVIDLAVAEARWVSGHLAPWLWRHARGISSGDGRSAKRPSLETVVPG